MKNALGIFVLLMLLVATGCFDSGNSDVIHLDAQRADASKSDIGLDAKTDTHDAQNTGAPDAKSPSAPDAPDAPDAPEVDDGPITGGSPGFAFNLERFENDAELIVTTDASAGFDFGTKLQAAPVLFDEVDNVFENGVRNPVRDNHTQGQIIEISSENPDEIYGGRGPSGPIFFETQEHLRVPGRPIYRMPGASTTHKDPAAGLASPYPTDGDKTMYLA